MPVQNNAMFSKTDLRKLIFPLIVEQLLGISVGMVDTIMISSLGEAAVSGVSLVDMINVLFTSLFAALATGGAVVVSQFIGAQNYKKARLSAGNLLLVTLAISLTIMGLILAFKIQIMKLLFGEIEPAVMQNALTYLFISAISFPFIALYNSCAALFRSLGNSTVTMIVSLISNIINIIGNSLLIYVFDLGVAGAAIASAFARFSAMAILFVLLFNKKRIIYFSLKEKFRINFAIIKKILYVGIPCSLENSLFNLGRILVVSIIAGFGTVQIAANAVANNLDALGCIPGQAMNLAMITVVGQCMGAGDLLQARSYAKKLLKSTYLYSAVWNTVIICSLPLTLKLYNLSPETLKLSAILIIIHCGFAILLWPASFTLPNALRAANDARFTMIVSLASMFVFRILLSYFLAKYFQAGAIGVWCAMVVDWIFRVIMFVHRFKGTKWQSHIIDTK